MATVATYLNFSGQAEEAFNFYKSVFGTEFEGAGILRHGDVPGEDAPDDVKNLVMNVALPILGGHILMASDIPAGMDPVKFGNNVQISLHPDTRAEADALYAALSEGGTPGTPMQEMFWGDYYGEFTDKFGIHWLVDTASKE